MKDHIITAKHQKTELRILLCCFVVAFLLNIIAVIIYNTSLVEIFTQIGYVLVVTIVLYLFIFLVRLVVFSIRALLGHHRSS